MNRSDNYQKYLIFREKFPFFSYDSYTWSCNEDRLEIVYQFNLAGQFRFQPVVTIPWKNNLLRPFDSLSVRTINALVFHTGLIEMISYWKAACPPVVKIAAGYLSPPQAEFWRKIYYQGLGEFFYLNSIPASSDNFMDLTCSTEDTGPILFTDHPEGRLVPVGGGKDSAMTLGLLNRNALDWVPMAINPGLATAAVIKASGKESSETIEIRRTIDPLLLDLNRQGFLNGHTPFSALLAFYSLLAAYLSGKKEIILSNESSASEATVPGTSINHQYSKSLEFEHDFRHYIQTFLTADYNYFSLLRPLSELQIAGVFAGMKQYHGIFRSCNAGSKSGTWCGKCPKCLFTGIILSPFLKPGEVSAIFGRNLLDDPDLSGPFEQLTGIQEIKPFECIGTVGEIRLALVRAQQQYDPSNLPFLLKKYQDVLRPEWNSGDFFESAMQQFSEVHFVGSDYLRLLKEALA